MEKKRNSIDQKEKARLQKEFDEIVPHIEADVNEFLDQNPEIKKKSWPLFQVHPTRNNGSTRIKRRMIYTARDNRKKQ